jgi:hypothetical protein
MVEKFVKTIIEKYSEPKLDLKIIRKKGNEKTYSGWLIQKIKESRQEGNLEVCELLQTCYKKYLEFQTKENILLRGWKGKSSLEIINKPDYFIITTYQKENQDEEPHQVNREITKIEINRIINCLNELNQGKRISTRDIGEKAYKRDWDSIFSDRFLHTNLNLILRLLDFYGLTHYRGKYTTIIKPVREIQKVLLLQNNKEIKEN